jgi:hypothetical protein
VILVGSQTAPCALGGRYAGPADAVKLVCTRNSSMAHPFQSQHRAHGGSCATCGARVPYQSAARVSSLRAAYCTSHPAPRPALRPTRTRRASRLRAERRPAPRRTTLPCATPPGRSATTSPAYGGTHRHRTAAGPASSPPALPRACRPNASRASRHRGVHHAAPCRGEQAGSINPTKRRASQHCRAGSAGRGTPLARTAAASAYASDLNPRRSLGFN